MFEGLRRIALRQMHFIIKFNFRKHLFLACQGFTEKYIQALQYEANMILVCFALRNKHEC